jgi:hypothetical protein
MVSVRAKLLSLAVFGAGALSGSRSAAVSGKRYWRHHRLSPETHRLRHQLAAQHCVHYDKTYQITTVGTRYGDYIAFRCYWPRGAAGVTLRRAH